MVPEEDVGEKNKLIYSICEMGPAQFETFGTCLLKVYF